MANHAICLLTYLAENPDAKQTYPALERATGIPRGTIWGMVNWKHEMAPHAGNPLFVWAWNLGYRVVVHNRPGFLLSVYRFEMDEPLDDTI